MSLICLIIFFPLFSFFLLSFLNQFLSKKFTAWIGISSIAMSTLITFYVVNNFLYFGEKVFFYKLWNWINIEKFFLSFNLLLDGLSATMLVMITCIGLLISIYSSEYMKNSEGFSRFFAYINLFISSMLLLILSDNLILMFFGWELVGLCSYLLIGFYYKEVNNCFSAIKAFIITRIGDIFLLFAIFLIYRNFGSFSFYNLELISENSIFILHHMSLKWIVLCLMIGALGKSAQVPLHTWLIDAMSGPTPVSALIHAATMVTAGVYLVSRMHSFFILTPEILYFLSVIGAITLLISSLSALVQNNIKCILAYSTMSQIGYMFLGLGVQAWYAVIFHLVVHAIFKALLFLSAGSVILGCKNEKNIFKIGGLYNVLFLEHVCFLLGGSSLIAFPVISAGFYSKGSILLAVYGSQDFYLLTIALIGVFLTAIYTCKIIFLVFYGKINIIATRYTSISFRIPLIILGIFSTFISSFFVLPLSHVFLKTYLSESGKFLLELYASMLTITGIYIAYALWIKRNRIIILLLNTRLSHFFYKFFLNGFQFDLLYHVLFTKSYLIFSNLLLHDPCRYIVNIPVNCLIYFNKILLMTVNGYLRWYISSMIMSVIVILIFMLIFCQNYFIFI
ncbi:NADH-quinone oxidoreductase subunit L [Buchnera aphidicola]|uniref:NADH-quinone oxidoreductase subunit L n=1 Tax=Buchnera aphidicola TaxID=9 RepID=UPI003463948F